MNSDKITTIVGAAAGGLMAGNQIYQQLFLHQPGVHMDWMQIIMGGLLAALGYYTNKTTPVPPPGQ